MSGTECHATLSGDPAVTRPPVRDAAVSVRDQLQNHARAAGDDFQRVLVRYGIERLLYRLAQSPLRDRFVLKGAMLFATWADAPFRATGDVDFLAFGDSSVESTKSAFVSLCDQAVDMEDGLVFDSSTIVVEQTREDENYKGLKVRLDAKLKNIVIPVLIDIGFGDVIHPASADIDYPRLLTDLPAARIRAYPPETVIAEKFDAMVRFGDQATRLKDHYDIWAISRAFEFDLTTLVGAVRGTLQQRGRSLPTALPAALTDTFAADARVKAQWTGFLRRTSPTLQPSSFPDLTIALRAFLQPVLDALQPDASPAPARWKPSEGWR
ncbi:MAG: nucleotidyl transferase AbiEii/AbiGii toxin family protein [Burkholderiales bacterium]|nr:MAG: nucleotidyl transferase AbiEii/AbiGii toxin family protein [Burkholderiales bacterium]